MGWLCKVADYDSVKEYADYELKGSKDFALLERSIYGKEVYSLYENIKSGDRFIMVDLITHGDGEWCIKSMDETCGPCYYNCPEYILVQSTSMQPMAIEWREACRNIRRLKRKNIDAAKKLVVDDIVYYRGKKLTYVRPYNKSYSQIVCRTEEGEIYRYPVKEVEFDGLQPSPEGAATQSV